MKKVYFDTNILLDIVLDRKPFVNEALILLDLIENNKILGYINSLSIVNIHYLVSKQKGKVTAKQIISDILQFFDVVNVDKSVIIQALDSDFNDFEDSVQEFSALSSGIDILLTRNTKDFKKSKLEVYEPSEYIKSFQK